MFERKSDKLLPFPRFALRVLYAMLFAWGIAMVSLSLGTLGYHFVAKLTWIDAVMNAAMILTGMGPVAVMPTSAAKLFASGYAMFSGVVFLSSIGLVFAPVFHRVIHRFHIDDPETNENKKTPRTR
jgi:hypothetical protein